MRFLTDHVCRLSFLGTNSMRDNSTTPDLFSERISVSLFNFAMNTAEVGTRKLVDIFSSTDLAWWFCGRLQPAVLLHSFIMFFAEPTPPAYGRASGGLALFCAPLLRKNMIALVVPLHVARRAKCHEVFGIIISPISVYVMNFKANFRTARFAFIFKKCFSRMHSKPFSVSILLFCEIFIPFTYFHWRTIHPAMGRV